MPLPGMLAEITQTKVKGHLIARNPAILDVTPPANVTNFENLVRSAAAQVVLLTGENPPTGHVRNLAVEAIAIQTASEVEYAHYPEEQNAGDTGRGYHLHQRYLELLADLRRVIDAANGVVPGGDGPLPGAGSARPRGRFPAAPGYPDPVRVTGRPWHL